MVLKEFEKFNQELKGCSWHEEKAKVLLMLFYRIFDCPKVNFGPLSTFAPWKGWRGTWKTYFPVKNGFSVNTFGPKMVAFLNSGCNISMRNSVHLWKFVRSSLGYQKYSRRFFYIYRKASWKNLIVKPSIPWKMLKAILHGLASIFIDSSFFSRDYNFSLRFLRDIHNCSGWCAFT